MLTKDEYEHPAHDGEDSPAEAAHESHLGLTGLQAPHCPGGMAWLHHPAHRGTVQHHSHTAALPSLNLCYVLLY